MGRQTWSKSQAWSLQIQSPLLEGNSLLEHVQIPTDGIDVWEIDIQLLKFGNKVASGSYWDLQKGWYSFQRLIGRCFVKNGMFQKTKAYLLKL